MSDPRSLPSPGLLVLLLLLAQPAWGGERAQFISPVAGSIVMGTTEFIFEVDENNPPVERIDVYVDGVLRGTATPPAWRLVADIEPVNGGTRVSAGVYGGGRLLEKLSLDTATADFSEAIDVVAVELFPVVLDRKGRYVSGLSVDQFHILEGGREISPDSFSVEPVSLTLALVLDVSGSMEHGLGTLKEASASLVDQLDPTDRVSLYSFNHALDEVLAPTLQHEAAKDAIATVSAAGGTALYDAIVQVAADLRPVRGRKAIVLFSDGRDERSLTSLSRSIEESLRADVILYAIGSGETRLELEARDDLRTLALETGGEAHFIRKLRDLGAVYDRILDDIRSQYSLSYTPPPGPAGERRVIVQVEGGHRVRCRKAYYYGAEN